MKKFLSENWRKLYFGFSAMIALSYCELLMYRYLLPSGYEEFWIAIPALVYTVVTFTSKFTKQQVDKQPIREYIMLISLGLMCFLVNNQNAKVWCISHFEFISVVVLANLLVGMIMLYFHNQAALLTHSNSKENTLLFNLFYLNTSKAHEIAMLIDNKIMKTIEKEHISEHISKLSGAISTGKNNNASTDVGYSVEDNSKKRVYENFDVKTTKSIMLRRIYETAQTEMVPDLNVGALVLFKSVELQQLNVDDTVMILNVLQDSKLKNQGNDSVEINLNKMMEKMLDDFTIDYSFSIDAEDGEKINYIIRLPYKSAQYFENGYQHSDLQLGKLSLIGIYRGKIDFSEKDSTSSRFLELITQSCNQERKTHDSESGMKLSYYTPKEKGDIPFEFRHKKLNDERHLVDVIAIIQEINLNRRENE